MCLLNFPLFLSRTNDVVEESLLVIRTIHVVHDEIEVVILVLEHDLRRASPSRRGEIGLVERQHKVHLLAQHAVRDHAQTLAAFQQVQFVHRTHRQEQAAYD